MKKYFNKLIFLQKSTVKFNFKLSFKNTKLNFFRFIFSIHFFDIIFRKLTLLDTQIRMNPVNKYSERIHIASPVSNQ